MLASIWRVFRGGLQLVRPNVGHPYIQRAMKQSLFCTLVFSLLLVCGWAERAKECISGALQHLTRATTTRPSPTIVWPSASTRITPMPTPPRYRLRRKGDYDKAIADYSEAIRIDPQNARAYYGRAYACGKKREFDKAIADYTEAIRLDPKYADAYQTAALPTAERVITTRPSPTTQRPSTSTRNTTKPITTVATPTGTRANTTRPSPTFGGHPAQSEIRQGL